ncbi:MAG: hypothetical protein JWO12_3244 [Frankiales bacterium]|nr:hypothetical protein [Frankiales bacterium]
MVSTRIRDDAGLIVLGWMTKLVLTMAVLGLIAFDGISVLTATFSAADRATTYANDAAVLYRSNKNIDTTYAAIVAEAKANGDTVDIRTFSVAPDGNASLTMHHTAHTIWMDRVSFLKKYTTVTEHGEGSPGS